MKTRFLEKQKTVEAEHIRKDMMDISLPNSFKNHSSKASKVRTLSMVSHEGKDTEPKGKETS